MAFTKRAAGARRPERAASSRYTVDASVFVNAFNPHADGHTASLELLRAIQERGEPLIAPTLLLPEVASAVARATKDSEGALHYASAIAALPHVTLVALTTAVARQAADLAATHRLRGADAIYIAVARRYGATLVSRDDEQRTRGGAVVICETPEEALENAPPIRTARSAAPAARRSPVPLPAPRRRR